MSMRKQGKYVTKSIRLTDDEAQTLAGLVAEHAASESALMRQWVLRGMRQFRIEQAVSAYQRDEVDMRGGAALAGIPIGVFLDELAARRVAVLDDPAAYHDGLEALRNTFGRGKDNTGRSQGDRDPVRAERP